MSGALLLRSTLHTLDDEKQWRASLLFKPDAGDYAKLPKLRLSGESKGSTPFVLEMNVFHEDQLKPDIEKIFGPEIAQKIGAQAFEVGQRGVLTLEAYRTGVECDRRYHYARLVGFEGQGKLMPKAALGACG